MSQVILVLIVENSETSGPIVRTGPNEVYTADPAAWQKMTNLKGEFLKSPEFYWALHPGISNVFTVIMPDVHRYFRRLLAHSISESGLKAFIPRIESKQRAAITGMQDEMKQRGAVDVQKWWLLMTYDTLTDLAFGEPAGVLQRGEVRLKADITASLYPPRILFIFC